MKFNKILKKLKESASIDDICDSPVIDTYQGWNIVKVNSEIYVWAGGGNSSPYTDHEGPFDDIKSAKNWIYKQ